MKPIDLSDYIQVLREHKLQIIIVFLAIFIPLFLISFEIVSTYESEATLFIERAPLKTEEIIFRRGSSRIDITKELVRLKSMDFAREIVKGLSQKTFSHLYEEMSLQERIFQRIKKIIGEKNYNALKKFFGRPMTAETKSPSYIVREVTEKIMDMKSVKYRGEGVITIEAQSDDPVVAYTIVQKYIDFWKAINLKENKRDMENAKEFIEAEVQKAKNQLDRAKQNYRKYRKYLDLPVRSPVAEQNYMDIDPQLAELASEVRSSEKNYNAWNTKLKEIMVWERLIKSDINVLDPPKVPEEPAGSGKNKTRIFAFLLALVVSLGLPLLVDFLKDYVKRPMDIKQTIDVPVVSIIPNMEKK